LAVGIGGPQRPVIVLTISKTRAVTGDKLIQRLG
jgi:hypothetical protein